MAKKRMSKLISMLLCGVVSASVMTSFAGCGGDEAGPSGGSKKDSIVLMTEELSGLFNPFYATSGADMDVIGMTQIGMLSTDSNGDPIVGDDQPTVVKAYDVKTVGTGKDEKSVHNAIYRIRTKLKRLLMQGGQMP